MELVASKPPNYARASPHSRIGTRPRWTSTTITIKLLPTSSKNPRRADIVLVLFPNSDLRTAKVRPALVVQADGLNTGLPQLVVTMISSNTRRAGHPSRVFISRSAPEGQETGLLTNSVVMTDNVAT